MILSFKSKETEKLATTGESRTLKAIERIALRKLDMIDAAIHWMSCVVRRATDLKP